MPISVLSRQEQHLIAVSPRSTSNIKAAALVIGAGAALLTLGATIAWQPYQLAVTRVAMVTISILLGGLAVARWSETVTLLRRTFWARDSATNLALLRITTFGTLWSLLGHERIVNAMVCREFWNVPETLGWLFALVPPSETLVYTGAALCKALCLLGLLGIFTRTSAAVCAVVGTYILGTTECLHVSHLHHVIWFLLILAVARSSDRLSLAAPFSASVTRAERSLVYGVPMRLFWLLLGIIYFFPGVGKLWKVGVDWIWTDNLPNMIIRTAFGTSADTTFLEAVPIMLVWQIAAMCVILFECTFFFLVFMGENVRSGLAGAAITFHQANGIIMRILFIHLQPFLLLLLNWRRIFLAVGKRLFRRRLAVQFSPACRQCISCESAIRHFDLCQRILPTYANGSTTAINFHWHHQRISKLMPIILRAPLTLVAIVCSYVSCATVGKIVTQAPSRIGTPLWPLTIGVSLVIIECACGFTDRQADWPFASYPGFGARVGNQLVLDAVELENSDGTSTTQWLIQSVPGLTKIKITDMLAQARSEGQDREKDALRFLCKRAFTSNPEWRNVQSVHVFQTTVQIGLDHPYGQPVRSHYLYSFSREQMLN